MLEANGNLTPPVTKEILRYTSERRGEPTYPELDPFWNKDFGWGMVDAYEAVKMSMRTENVDAVDVEGRRGYPRWGRARGPGPAALKDRRSPARSTGTGTPAPS